jgi:hypothetical protein
MLHTCGTAIGSFPRMLGNKNGMPDQIGHSIFLSDIRKKLYFLYQETLCAERFPAE